MAGTRLTVTGRVTDLSCHPLAGAVLDFWQADASGNYDNSGYRLRGHEATDADGRYSLLTIVPGEYPGRTQHIHVKVTAPGRPTLTTQLYFPGSARNSSDSIFDPALLMNVTDAAGGGKLGTYDFVLGA
jgi:protocatechuate 3,4-dioxygenase beta subunit